MRKTEQLKFTCKCSFLEIYNEQITDLLEPSSTNLQVRSFFVTYWKQLIMIHAKPSGKFLQQIFWDYLFGFHFADARGSQERSLCWKSKWSGGEECSGCSFSPSTGEYFLKGNALASFGHLFANAIFHIGVSANLSFSNTKYNVTQLRDILPYIWGI